MLSRPRRRSRMSSSSVSVIAAALVVGAAFAMLRIGGGLDAPGREGGGAVWDRSGDAHAAESRMGARLSPAPAAAKGGDGFQSDVPPDGLFIEAMARHRAGPNATPAEIEAQERAFMREWLRTNYHGPEPERLDALMDRERRMLDGKARGAAGANVEPAGVGDVGDRAARSHEEPAGVGDAGDRAMGLDQGVSGALRVLAVAVEFAGSDTVENFSHPVSRYDSTCVTETITYSGPLHNEIPPPAERDNYTWWLPQFDAAYYEKLIFSTEGVTERIRKDLTDPKDGLPGIDISGRTMATYFDEVSGGRVTFDGGSKGVIAWVQVPHSVAYYSSNACIDGVAGGNSAHRGLPTNPRFPNGTRTLIEDIATALNAGDPDFPWAEYDTDGDGVVDHFQMIYAGMSRGVGGGTYGYQTIWAHRGNAGGVVVDDRGTPEDNSDDIRIQRYTAQAENTSLGTLVHEFGHDFGLPDLYDTSYGGTSNAAWWDLMGYGGSTGEIRGSRPALMSTWMKMVLGWEDPLVVTPTAEAELIDLGQLSGPPPGTESALMVEMPPSGVTLVTPQAGSTEMMWSGNDSNWADLGLWRPIDLEGVTGTITLTFDLDHVTEEDGDFLFLEVRPGGSSTYVQTPGYEVGTDRLLTTPEDYADPKGSLASFGGLMHGYTGDSEGWVRVYHDLSAYAGQSIRIRARYATDGSLRERGAFLDNFRLLADGEVVWADPVESGAAGGWRTSNGTFTHLYGMGWRQSNGVLDYPWYYLLEWRSLEGFDGGLGSTYQEVFRNLTADGATEINADWLPTNAPGLLVWLRDTRYGSSNNLVADQRFFTQPSEGPKGGLLLVDSHPEPLRGDRQGTYTNSAGTTRYPPNDNWHGNVQSTNAAFSLRDTPAVTLTYATGFESPATYLITRTLHASQPAVRGFHDALGYFPGIEVLPEPVTVVGEDGVRETRGYAFTDPDSSVVVPASGYYPPRTPPDFTGVSEEEGAGETVFLRTDQVTGSRGPVVGDDVLVVVDVGEVDGPPVIGERTGNPGDSGVHFGYHFVVEEQAADGSWGKVRVWRAGEAAEVGVGVGVVEGGGGGGGGIEGIGGIGGVGRGEGSAGGAGGAGADASVVEVESSVVNVGGAYSLTLYSAFDPELAMFVEGSGGGAGGGDAGPDVTMWPVSASAAEVVAAVAAGGPDALAALAVPAEEARAAVWSGFLGSGRASGGLRYRLAPKRMDVEIRVTSSAYAGDPGRALDVGEARVMVGPRVYLPVVEGRE